MKLRIGILALLLLTPATSSVANLSDAQAGTTTVLVWVRDRRGAPVPGLSANDFLITENGSPNRVLAVRNFASAPAATSPNNVESAPGMNASSLPSDDSDATHMATQVLLIISPMGPRGRHDTLRDAIRLLDKPLAARWKLGLLDDEGTLVPFGQSAEQMRAILEKLAARVSAPQYQPLFGDEWTPKAARAIRELGALPGRHVIVCISDYDSKSIASVSQNPTLLRVFPTMFIGEAVSAQAAMYTVEGNGAAVAVPFGGAADSSDSWSSGPGESSGQNVANRMVADIVGLGVLRSDLLHAADETGGLPANDLKDAFKRIAEDAAGYYLVTFEVPPGSHEASLRPFTVSTRFSSLKVKGPRFYLAPRNPLAVPLPESMKAALQNPANTTGLRLAADAWLFPNHGSVHWAAFAADVRFQKGAPPPGPHVKIHAELVNESLGAIADAWNEEGEWRSAGGVRPFHWQQEAYIYPGSYTLRVTAMDTASGIIAEAADTFLARPLDTRAFRFGAIVLADDCLPESEQQKMRRNLFDPLRWGSCKLAPAATGSFRASQAPLLLLRIYPPDRRLTELVEKQWKAYAVVDDAEDKAIPLQISSAPIRGLAVTGKLPLADMNLEAGIHDLRVLFVIPEKSRETKILPLHTRFSVEP